MNPTELTDAGLQLLTKTAKASRAYGRPDLAERVSATRERLADDYYRVMVVGEFKHGKSSLLNAVLGETVTPVDADVATSAPVLVRFGNEQEGVAILNTAGGTERQSFPLHELTAWVTEGGNPGNRRQVRRVEVFMPHPILEAGLAFVDTPGVGGLASSHGTVTAAALPMADAVMFVSDAAQELSSNEVDFLRTVLRICPNVAYVSTKIDLHHHWRRILEIDTDHLARLELDLPVFPVSSQLCELANDTDDDSLAVESGFKPLVRWLGRELATKGRRRSVRLIAAEVDQVVEQLMRPFIAERDVLQSADPTELVERLDRAKQHAEELKGAAGKWSGVMSDGFGDLQSDIDHDMRQRMRDLNQQLDEQIEAMDPADAWPEFERWLYQETSAGVTANYASLCEEVDRLVRRVCELFGEESDGAQFVAQVTEADQLIGGVDAHLGTEMRKATMVQQGMSVLRGGYSTVGMFGMYAGFAGVALSNPVSAALALVMGRKGLKDERQRQLGQRRAQAKTAARRYVEEVNFVVGKDSRDMMRHLQRDLRAFFAARADEVVRSAADAAQAAQRAVKADASGRDERLAVVAAELGRLAKLTETAEAIVELDAAVQMEQQGEAT